MVPRTGIEPVTRGFSIRDEDGDFNVFPWRKPSRRGTDINHLA